MSRGRNSCILKPSKMNCFEEFKYLDIHIDYTICSNQICIDVVTEYAFQITRPSVIDDVAEILEEVEVERRHHT